MCSSDLVKGHVEAKLVNEKAKAAILVADEDVDAMKAQVGRITLRGCCRTHARIIKRNARERECMLCLA